MPSPRLHPLDVSATGHALISPDDFRDGVVACLHYHDMHVIGHYYMEWHRDVVIIPLDVACGLVDGLARIIQQHCPVGHIAKQTLPVVGDDSDEVASCGGVVIPLHP